MLDAVRKFADRGITVLHAIDPAPGIGTVKGELMIQRGRRVTLASCGLGLATLVAACSGTGAQPAGNSRSAPPSTAGSSPTSSVPPPSATSTTPPSTSTAATPTPTTTGTPTHPATGEAGKCTTAMLSGKLVAGSPGAGQRYASLVLSNTSSKTCTIYGYGGLALRSSAGHPITTHLSRTPDPGPTTVTLTPGAAAAKNLHWTAVPAGDEQGGLCEPTPGSARVIPPDETHALTVSWTAGPVCQHGRIEGSAYHPK